MMLTAILFLVFISTGVFIVRVAATVIEWRRRP